MQIRNCALHKTHVFFRFDLKHGACSLRPGRIVKELIWTLEAMEVICVPASGPCGRSASTTPAPDSRRCIMHMCKNLPSAWRAVLRTAVLVVLVGRTAGGS